MPKNVSVKVAIGVGATGLACVDNISADHLKDFKDCGGVVKMRTFMTTREAAAYVQGIKDAQDFGYDIAKIGL
jgi:hypothetical protein